MDEVMSHLQAIPGSEIEMSIEVLVKVSKITEEEIGFWCKRKEGGISVRFGTANRIKVLFLE